MIFSSNLFVFLFLPLFILSYFIVPQRWKNSFLLLFSLFFYFWGSGYAVLLLIFSILFNYYLGQEIEEKRLFSPKASLITGVVANLALLGYFKYAQFFYHELGNALSLGGIDLPEMSRILLPLGISFYTFKSVAYLVEVYRGTVSASRSLVGLGVYIASFTQLLAGPIQRYSEMQNDIHRRTANVSSMHDGILRFSIGLGKKALLANNLGAVADKIFLLTYSGEMTVSLAWLGALCYAMQIYFDFAGYTDMAIGIGKMMGFNYPENFDHPYRASNVTEFWRRWHMTLTRWFRDFLYIPMGGNRRGQLRTYLHLWLVFIICGLWHGAAWTLIFWGCYHGVLLMLERLLQHSFGFKPSGPLGVAYTFLAVLVGWVFFRAESFSQAWTFSKAMVGITPEQTFIMFSASNFLSADILFYLAVALILSFAPVERLKQIDAPVPARKLLQMAMVVLLLLLSAAYLSVSAFTPFIYFQF